MGWALQMFLGTIYSHSNPLQICLISFEISPKQLIFIPNSLFFKKFQFPQRMSGMKVPPPAYDESISVGHFPPSPQFPPQQQPIIISNAQPQQSSVPPPTDLDEHLGPYPQQAYCQTCKGYFVTQTKHVSGLFTWILVFLFILFGLFCGCCLLPLCVKSCKDVEHRCPQCKTYLGTFQRVFGTRRNQQRVPIIRRA